MERTTCTVGMTVSPIPESVTGVESAPFFYDVLIPRQQVPRLTEIIFSNKLWDRYNTISITWTVPISVVHIILSCSISKCPDMLSRTAIHQSHTINIGTINCSLSFIITIKGTWQSILVGSDLTTHLTVWSSINREEH